MPTPADPESPTISETLAVAVALMTALGVAAARAIWQRAQDRKGRTDRGRDHAGKTSAGGSGSGAGGGRGSRNGGLKSPSGLKSLGGSPKGKSPKSSRSPSGLGAGTKPRSGKGLGGSGGGSRKGPEGGKKTPGGKAVPKAAKGGKTAWEAAKKLRRRKKGDGDGQAPKPKQPGKDSTAKPKAVQRPLARKLTWKAPKKGEEESGRKRWKRTDDGGSGGKSGSKVKRRLGGWWKRWKNRATPDPAADPAAEATQPTADEDGQEEEAEQQEEAQPEAPEEEQTEASPPPPPPPPPGPGGMRPPPGAAPQETTWTAEQIFPDPPPPRTPEAVTGAPPTGRLALGPPVNVADDPEPPQPAQQEGPPVSTLARTAPYSSGGQVDLTVYDVIEADADMEAEITDGVATALGAADGCERLRTRLETLRAKVIDLKVPGSLESDVLGLMELVDTIRIAAQSIASTLPTAAEAISVAGANAAARHKGLADVTRDMGHARPAERPYHDE
ncbi:hypothetical protein ACFYY8_33470 [Streptosporangium sp. NPDC001559]|uniref:hypothetical protein n=1 Tax=Streptosporangium sp. NPDC001559 TaxID=3366187 RepID=UPI0036ED542B